jgi:predicted transposase YdaD
MCEVAERLKNSGRAEGEFIGKIKFALKLNWNIPDIAKEVGISVDEVQEIIDREHLA